MLSFLIASKVNILWIFKYSQNLICETNLQEQEKKDSDDASWHSQIETK